MCYNGMCLSCIPVENGCRAFGILHMISSLSMLLKSLPLLVNIRSDKGKAETPEVVVTTSIMYLVGFISSAFLCHGISKRRPEPVKAFFIVSVMMLVPSIYVFYKQMGPLVELESMGYIIIIVTLVVGFGIYGLILWMVFATYVKLCSEAAHKNHVTDETLDLGAVSPGSGETGGYVSKV